eukprot:1611417-Pyramimonas_sp.AAC.1
MDFLERVLTLMPLIFWCLYGERCGTPVARSSGPRLPSIILVMGRQLGLIALSWEASSPGLVRTSTTRVRRCFGTSALLVYGPTRGSMRKGLLLVPMVFARGVGMPWGPLAT